MSNQLKLKAKDAEDVQIISAVLQDAIAPICDMAYRPEEKDFIIVVQRFCREPKADSLPCFERVRCAVHVRGVENVQTHNVDLTKRDTMLDLLAVLPENKALQFIFAGGGKIRVQLSNWSIALEDFGEPWPTTHAPCHDDGVETPSSVKHT